MSKRDGLDSLVLWQKSIELAKMSQDQIIMTGKLMNLLPIT
jgi:hypothetical protein